MSDVDRPLVAAFVESLKHSSAGRLSTEGLSDATIARRLAVLSSFLDFVRATSFPELRNPIKEMRRKRHNNRSCKAVDEAVLSQLLSGITVLRDKTLFAMYLSTGLRLTELRSLNKDSISFDLRVSAQGSQSVSGSGQVVGKGSKLRRFYVDPHTLPLYAKYLQTRVDENPALFVSERKQRMSARAIQFTLASWCSKLGLQHIHAHQLRHQYATRLANADCDPMHLKDLMGHNDFNTTLGYFKIREEKIAQGYFAAMEVYRPSSV
ncbi:tyrosine-type recombinase/integrase [Tunturiibacter empetritectus]|uniref:tyrosine-type recombinase/integrase n=1 Tax=Tunturiibacter empetritectus TaxID=3069691 RepID=UPI003D9BFA86